MMDIFFSIIVPVYNAEKYLNECIDSVIEQRMSEYELLLVDDGSTDRSGEICDDYAASYPFIKVIHQRNSGQLAARQSAICIAAGNYLLFLDADDYLEQNAMERIKQAIEESHSDCVIFGFNRVWDGKVIDSTDTDFAEYTITSKSELYRRVFFRCDYNSVCRKAVKASLVSRERWLEYDSAFLGEDLIQSLEIYRNAESVTIIPDCLYYYRMNPESITHTVTDKNFDYEMRARALVLETLQRDGVLSEKDMLAYYSVCCQLFTFQILVVARMKCSLSSKKELLEKMRSTNYCEALISASKECTVCPVEYSFLWKLFVRRRYAVILLVTCAIYSVRNTAESL